MIAYHGYPNCKGRSTNYHIFFVCEQLALCIESTRDRPRLTSGICHEESLQRPRADKDTDHPSTKGKMPMTYLRKACIICHSFLYRAEYCWRRYPRSPFKIYCLFLSNSATPSCDNSSLSKKWRCRPRQMHLAGPSPAASQALSFLAGHGQAAMLRTLPLRLDGICPPIFVVDALQVVRPGGEGGNVPGGLEPLGTIGLEPERACLGGTQLAHAFHGLRSNAAAHILVLLRGGDVAAAQPAHEVDLAHHVADVPGHPERKEAAGDSATVLQRVYQSVSN